MRDYPDFIRLSKWNSSVEEAIIKLPLSKSIGNRLLIISELSNGRVRLKQLPETDDTESLINNIHRNEGLADVGHAGTAMRFLIAFFAAKEGVQITLTGSDRMKKRPVKILVDALLELGADVSYPESPGYPPVFINGKSLLGGTISIPANVSSQYISALMMIAPHFKNGLSIKTVGERVSEPYIMLTAGLMQKCGIDVTIKKEEIFIPTSQYKKASLNVEADWSAAAFFFGVCAITRNKIKLLGLEQRSLQGDSWLVQWFTNQGMSLSFDNEGLSIDPSRFKIDETHVQIDLLKCPDLAQMFAVLFTALKKSFTISGLQTLPIKETNRIQALHNELSKFNVIFDSYNEDCISANAQNASFDTTQTILTYEDHRMAMAFSLLAFKCDGLIIEKPAVVKKSFPSYWEAFSLCGVNIMPCSKQ
jgi:3-phosphoshikimate 1-carboxyvinyltransferase